jgi:hypothetical protein
VTSFPRHRHDADGNVPDESSDDTAPDFALRPIVAHWPLLMAIFAAGGTCATFAMQSARIDKLELRQTASDTRLDSRWQVMDDRMRGVETGLATLLERTKPKP